MRNAGPSRSSARAAVNSFALEEGLSRFDGLDSKTVAPLSRDTIFTPQRAASNRGWARCSAMRRWSSGSDSAGAGPLGCGAARGRKAQDDRSPTRHGLEFKIMALCFDLSPWLHNKTARPRRCNIQHGTWNVELRIPHLLQIG